MMRLGLLLAGVTLIAGGTAGVRNGLIPPPSQMMAAAARALGFDPTKVGPAHINPVQAAYDRVQREVLTPKTPDALGFKQAGPILTPEDINRSMQNMQRLTLEGPGTNGIAPNSPPRPAHNDAPSRDVPRAPVVWNGTQAR
jgi:hypothetical protein